jgi:type I restriction enzyme S subunit
LRVDHFKGRRPIAPGSRVDGRFLLSYIRSSETQSWIEKQVKGATFREITLARLREMPVAVPPSPAQAMFARRIMCLETLRQKSRAAEEGFDSLFASLQHRAFNGEL